ncbi:MAG: hypothetical protein ABIG10_01660 [bacterium]
MPSPVLTQSKTERPLTVLAGAKRIFQAIYHEQNKPADDDDQVAKIMVSDLISKMAFYYEKIRNSVDYKEEYLLRKGAILRILKRHVVIESSLTGNKAEDVNKLSASLLSELIRAGYLANNKLPVSSIDDVAVILDKYLKLKNYALMRVGTDKFFYKNTKLIRNETETRTELTNWIVGMVASEVEEYLSYSKATEVTVGYMYQLINNNIRLPADLPYDDDLPIQVYLGIYRNFLKLDDYDLLSYVLLKYYYPTWGKMPDEDIEHVASKIGELRKLVHQQINHPLRPQLKRIIHHYTVYFTILKDVVEENPKKVFEDLKNDPRAFSRQIKQACIKRYTLAKKRLWHSAVRSIIYIFLTKSVFAVLLEVPATQFFGEQINNFSMAINIAFPAIVLFVAVAVIRLPGAHNTEKIVKGVEEIVFAEHQRQQPIILRKPVKRGAIISSIFTIIYTITFFLSFGLVIWALDKIQFSWVSIIIFLFFLVFAAFFAVRIRRGPKSLIVVEPKENIFTFLWNFFYIPVISTGKWLSNKFSRINVFVFILDFIIEAPFKVFVGIAEEWTKYVRERKEEIT